MSQPAIGRKAFASIPGKTFRHATSRPSTTGNGISAIAAPGASFTLLVPMSRQRSCRVMVAKTVLEAAVDVTAEAEAAPTKTFTPEQKAARKAASSGAAAMRAKALAAELSWRAATYGVQNPQLVDLANKLQTGPAAAAAAPSTNGTHTPPLEHTAAPHIENIQPEPAAAPAPVHAIAAAPVVPTKSAPATSLEFSPPAVDIPAVKAVVVKKPAAAAAAPAAAPPPAAALTPKAGPSTPGPARIKANIAAEAAAKPAPAAPVASTAASAIKAAAASVASAIQVVKAPSKAAAAASEAPKAATPVKAAAAAPAATVKAAAAAPAAPIKVAATAPAATPVAKAAAAPATAAVPKVKAATKADDLEAARQKKIEEVERKKALEVAARKAAAEAEVLAKKQAAELARKKAEEAEKRRQEEAVLAKKRTREVARAEVKNLNHAQAAMGKSSWLHFTVPEKPVAGEECVVFYNRVQSESLRMRPRILMQYGFNRWELEPNSKIDLLPSAIPKNDCDWWSAMIKVPEDTFEMNFVFTDGAGLFDNNVGQDFVAPTMAGVTVEDWEQIAVDRLLEAEKKRKEEEEKQAIEAEKKRAAALLEEDKAKGRQRAEELRKLYTSVSSKLIMEQRVAEALLWYTSPQPVRAGTKGKLYFNNKVGPLKFLSIPQDQVLTIRYGYNGWKTPITVPMARAAAGDVSTALPTDDWWMVDLDIPEDAATVSFVLNYHQHWDNNNKQDYTFALALPEGLTVDTWVEGLAEKYRLEEYNTRIEAERVERELAEKRMIKRRKAQAEAVAVSRRQIKYVLFTEPEELEAGDEVTLYYNPSETPLNGSGKIFLIGGFNRWKHKKTIGPLELIPPGDGGLHWRVTVTVPADAYKLDFVFANVPGGAGTYDNRGGLDYSLPVSGTPVREPPLHVVHIAVEMAPIAKVGGLGDVVTALARAVKDEGHSVEVIVPRYDFFMGSPILRGNMQPVMEFDWGGTRIFVTQAIVEGLTVFFIEPRNGFFARQQVYTEVWDDEVKFDFFCKAALEFLLKSGRQPDILHAHDWSTAHVARAYWQDYNPFGLWKPKVVFTIHNLEYGQKRITDAASFCQKFTTVSPTYAFEIGGQPAIKDYVSKFMGIRNGIDPELWDPETCKWLPLGYTSENVVEGKRAAKQALRQRLNLTSWGDKMVIGVVSRLTKQKGMHLIKHAAFRTLDRGGQFVLLGNAPNPKDQADFEQFAGTVKGQDAAFEFKYDEPLSHLIYAACDIILVPSMFEPCGLTQMIAMRYGAVPVVRHTGGLKDTVFDVDFDKARAAWSMAGSSDYVKDGVEATNGFAFEGADEPALDYALNRAIDTWYNDREWFHGLQKRCMEQDWSWNRPAIDYIELYHAAIKKL